MASINIPDGVTLIDNWTFFNCSSLTSINIPNSVTYIDYNAFWGCTSLTSINVPIGVTFIGSEAFWACVSLVPIYITDLSAWCKITFEDSSSNPLNKGAKLYLNNKELTELVIPKDIKQVNNYAFNGCNSLIKINIGDDVTSIGLSAFNNCSSLTSVMIGAGVTTIGKEAFRSCSSLTSIYCYATTPPVINTTDSYSSFDKYEDNTTLYVPKGCSSKYKSSWGNYFKNIKEMD